MAWVTKNRIARYINGNGYACAIVAVINITDSELFDWSAYMGGCSPDISKQEGVDFVARYGSKLSCHDAAHYFTDLPMSHYRD